MKVYEILSLAPEFLKRLHDLGINPNDCRWVELYREYARMKGDGEKVVYIVAFLSRRYGICERKVYKIVRMMEKDCQIDAAGTMHVC